MPNSKRVLLAVDGSEGSNRVVAYAAEMLGGSRGFHVALLHLEEPPRMLEWGGSEDPAVEDRVSSERAEACRQMEKQAVAEGKGRLQRFQGMLVEKGIDSTVLLVQFEEPLSRKNIAHRILQTAQQRGYGTVVVGRHMLSGWESLFRNQVGEELVRTAEGIAIWVAG